MNSELNHTLTTWIQLLDRYTFQQLLVQPAPGQWSLGQVYMHLVETGTYHARQIEICISSDKNKEKEATPEAKLMFANNAFPNVRIDGPASNARTQQPSSMEQLRHALLELQIRFNHLADRVNTGTITGKTKHPGLHYFSAKEWLQFADMHLRHHFRQQQRLDTYLKQNR